MPIRLPMKLGVSFASTTPLPSRSRRKAAEALLGCRLRLGSGDQLDETHRANRIEEVGDDRVLLQPLGHAIKKSDKRNARRIGGDDRPVAPRRFDLGKDRMLDVEVLDHRLANPIAGGQIGELVIEVSSAQARLKGSAFLIVDGKLQRAHPALFGKFGRGFEQQDLGTRSGAGRRYAASHRTAADNGNLRHCLCHDRIFKPLFLVFQTGQNRPVPCFAAGSRGKAKPSTAKRMLPGPGGALARACRVNEPT